MKLLRLCHLLPDIHFFHLPSWRLIAIAVLVIFRRIVSCHPFDDGGTRVPSCFPFHSSSALLSFSFDCAIVSNGAKNKNTNCPRVSSDRSPNAHHFVSSSSWKKGIFLFDSVHGDGGLNRSETDRPTTCRRPLLISLMRYGSVFSSGKERRK